MNMETTSSKREQRVGAFQLLLSIFFGGVDKPLLKLLIQQGGPVGIVDANAISFCNVLFVGNLCAGIIPLVYVGARKIIEELRDATFKMWLLLAKGTLLRFIYVSLIFYSLNDGMVINVVLILRFRGIVYAIISYLFHGERVSKSDLLGYIFIIIGLLVLLFGQNGLQMAWSDLIALIASVFYGASSHVDKKNLQHISVPSYLFLTSFLSAIGFYIIVIAFYDLHHFADAFQPQLWIEMMAYAGIGVMLTHIFWLSGIRKAKVATVTNMALVSPLFSIFFAYLLLGEIPDGTQLIAMAIIFGGLILSAVVGHTSIVKHDESSSQLTPRVA